MKLAHSYRQNRRAGLNQAGPDKQRREAMNIKMQNHGVRFALACLLLMFGIAWASPAQADVTYSGRAFAVFLNVPTLGVGPTTVSDTVGLPPSGGVPSSGSPTVAGPLALDCSRLGT